MTSNTSLELEALIRPVSALLLEVPELLLRLTNFPRPDNPKKDIPPFSRVKNNSKKDTPPSPTVKDNPKKDTPPPSTVKDTSTDAPGPLLHPNNIPGIDKLQEDTPPSPANTSTGNTDTEIPIVIPLGKVEKVKNNAKSNTSSKKAPQHPRSNYRTPEHSTLPTNTPVTTHKDHKPHNTQSNTPKISKKYTDTHTPESIESKLVKLHIVPLRKYSENAPPDNSKELPGHESTTRHAFSANNNPNDPAPQSTKPIKKPEPPKDTTDDNKTDGSHKVPNSTEVSEHASTTENKPGSKTSDKSELEKLHELLKDTENPDSRVHTSINATNESENAEEERNNQDAVTQHTSTDTTGGPRDATTQTDKHGDPPPEVAAPHVHNGDEF